MRWGVNEMRWGLKDIRYWCRWDHDFPRIWIVRVMAGYSFLIFPLFNFHQRGCQLMVIFIHSPLVFIFTHSSHESIYIQFLYIPYKPTGGFKTITNHIYKRQLVDASVEPFSQASLRGVKILEWDYGCFIIINPSLGPSFEFFFGKVFK